MSIDHSYIIVSINGIDVVLNIAGLDDGNCSTENITASIYAYESSTGIPKFTCPLTVKNLVDLYSHLRQYKMFTSNDVKDVGTIIELGKRSDGIFELLNSTNSHELVIALNKLIKSRLTTDDLNTILGRKEALAEFGKMLQSTTIGEKEWQEFFEKNEWIFGYGLKYKYLKILQREAHISCSDLNGSNDVITDYLMSDTKFTKIVELKRPDTPLFKNLQNRSDSWKLSSELSDAVSQILSQKANWELDSQRKNYTSDGYAISELTVDVECILIIGTKSSIVGTKKEMEIKHKTLELYRRNLRNIEILTYDELYERALFIISNKIVG